MTCVVSKAGWVLSDANKGLKGKLMGDAFDGLFVVAALTSFDWWPALPSHNRPLGLDPQQTQEW